MLSVSQAQQPVPVQDLGNIVLSESIMKTNVVEILRQEISKHSKLQYIVKSVGQIFGLGSAIASGLTLKYQDSYLSVLSVVFSGGCVICHQLCQDQSVQSDVKRAQKKALKKN